MKIFASRFAATLAFGAYELVAGAPTTFTSPGGATSLAGSPVVLTLAGMTQAMRLRCASAVRSPCPRRGSYGGESHLYPRSWRRLGGSIWSQNSLTARKCTFTGNSAGAEGGAIQSWGDSPSLLVENATFSGNNTSNGIASANDCGASSMTLRHVTVTNNSATNGSALVIFGTSAHDDQQDHRRKAGTANNGAFNASQSTNNILGSGGTGGLTNGVNGNQTGIPVSQLYLGSLGNNGGPTTTIPLLPGSPAIDAGVAIAGLTSDQRGTLRPQANTPGHRRL